MNIRHKQIGMMIIFKYQTTLKKHANGNKKE